MWPITLSGRLLIVALVGRYLTNQLIRREPISHRIAPLTLSLIHIYRTGAAGRLHRLFPAGRSALGRLALFSHQF